MAGPFTREDFARLVPADKKLSAAWIRALTARGEREVYRGEELPHIGLPIGGLCAGQLYLGGDGRLWHWDIFNRPQRTGAEHYAHPRQPASPLAQGFALRASWAGRTEVRPLAAGSWRDITFIGEYPIGTVRYADPALPLQVTLEAFSPFAPLATEDSSLPATVLQFTVHHRGPEPVTVELAGWLENAVGQSAAESHALRRVNTIERWGAGLWLDCRAEAAPPAPPSSRPDILFDDFESPTYEGWTATGTAFGAGPVTAAQVPSYQGELGQHGQRTVNTHASSPGRNARERDTAQGRLVSRAFTIERDYINFLIGGGAQPGKACLNVVVGGQVVATATGTNANRMRPMSLAVRRWAGQTAHLEIVDAATGGWGQIGIDYIVFSDQRTTPLGPLAEEPDFGTMGLALLPAAPGATGGAADAGSDWAHAALAAGEASAQVFATSTPTATRSAGQSAGTPLLGGLGRRFTLAPGAQATVTFVVAWHFPNLRLDRLPTGRWYAQRFASARAVAQYVAENQTRLTTLTRRWHEVWYESSLPYWFLNRTFLNTSILASSTCYRFGDGRFYAWEGVGCCPGTCTHVWHYAHAMARLFPDLERGLRERVDFGLALQADGAIFFRGELNKIPAVDGQAGSVLRAWREHQMSADGEFLRRNWPAIRRATSWLIAKDAEANGLLGGNQHNTLDTDWFGPVAWLSGLYQASLRAAEAMGREVGDDAFATRCGILAERGQRVLVERLFDGEYYFNQPDPKKADTINSGTGCHIDQVMGQSWAWQVGLPRVSPEKETRAALAALWRYNFTPDVGPYREAYKAGRWYAMPGEAGLLMCTFPRSGWDYAQAKGKGPDWAAGYFNECMNGFEYQVAGHMLWEGMITEGLAITRALHDRYHPSRRNPYNEVECGDHYARSMASYGVYLAACGYEYHGPQGHLGFAPRLHAEDFRAAFTAAEGWGRFAQRRTQGTGPGEVRVELHYGRLRLRTLALAAAARPLQVTATLGERAVAVASAWSEARGGRLLLTLGGEAGLELREGETLRLTLT